MEAQAGQRLGFVERQWHSAMSGDGKDGELDWGEADASGPIVRERLDPALFNLPAQQIRSGFYSDKYFVRAGEMLRRTGDSPEVLMQVFSKSACVLCGTDEAIALLKLASHDWQALEVRARHDGDTVKAFDIVMTIKGPYEVFAHLETLYLGVLARGTRVATNTRRAVKAAGGKDVLFFPARFDHWLVQARDGYAAHIGGATAVSTDAQGSWWGGEGVGTIPHAIIAACGGDTVLAARKFAECFPETIPLVVLVDFENDCVRTALEVARALGPRLYGVRLDTSGTMVDLSVQPMMGQFDPRGVNLELVCNVRKALDAEGFQGVRIVASGGFNGDKIQRFEEHQAPVDAYGVGSTLFANAGQHDFTADIVRCDGKAIAKVGRAERFTPDLETVK